MREGGGFFRVGGGRRRVPDQLIEQLRAMYSSTRVWQSNNARERERGVSRHESILKRRAAGRAARNAEIVTVRKEIINISRGLGPRAGRCFCVCAASIFTHLRPSVRTGNADAAVPHDNVPRQGLEGGGGRGMDLLSPSPHHAPSRVSR